MKEENIDPTTLKYLKAVQYFETVLNWNLSSTDFNLFIEIHEMVIFKTVCKTCGSDLAQAKLNLINWKNNTINNLAIPIEIINNI